MGVAGATKSLLHGFPDPDEEGESFHMEGLMVGSFIHKLTIRRTRRRRDNRTYVTSETLGRMTGFRVGWGVSVSVSGFV